MEPYYACLFSNDAIYVLKTFRTKAAAQTYRNRMDRECLILSSAIIHMFAMDKEIPIYKSKTLVM